MVLIPEIRSIDFSIPISSVSSILFLVEPKRHVLTIDEDFVGKQLGVWMRSTDK